jgi:thioredoxin 1
MVFDSTVGREEHTQCERSRNRKTDYERNPGMAEAVTESTFEHEVLQADKPVLVDFWAEWCGPCHAVAPILDRIVEERAGEIKLVKVNIDEEPEIAERYGIASIPTMVLFKDGEPAAAAIGAQPKGALETQLGLSPAETNGSSG